MKYIHSILLLFILLFHLPSVNAQKLFYGNIKDNHGNPLAGASVSIAGSYDGAVTDSAGSYSFSSKITGTITITATLLGYKNFSEQLLTDTLQGPVNIILKEEITELKAVVITAGTFEASDKKRGTVLKPLDIVTTASAEGDINGAMRTLPGVQQIGESGELFVRGGAGSESKTFIDGMTINNPNFTGVQDIGSSQRNRFSPFLFKGTIFSSGGYSALYGNAMSAALIMETNDLPARSEASANLTTIGAGAGYQGLAKNKKLSYGINLDYSNLSPTFSVLNLRNISFPKAPEYFNAETNFRIKTGSSGLLKFYSYASINKTIAEKPHLIDPDAKEYFNLKNTNSYNNLSYKLKLKNKWGIYTAAAFGSNTDKIINDSLYKNESKDPVPVTVVSNLFQAKLVATKDLANLSAIRFGGEFFSTYDSYNVASYFNDKFSDSYIALYAETDVYFTTKFVARAGIRAEHSSLLKKFNVAPRISLAYKLTDKSQLSFAYGQFYQKPESQFLSQTRNLDFTKATHFIANYQFITDKQVLRTEVFYKRYTNLIKTLPAIGNSDSGYAKGFEVFWRDRKTFKKTDYWLSYSFLDTKRNFLNYPFSVQPGFAATHTATAVVKHMINKLKTNVGASYSFASGRPYINPNRGMQDFMSDRTMDFHSLGINLNYLTTINKMFAVFVFSITNVLGNKQVFGYNYLSYKVNNVYEGRAIVPPAKRFLFAGVFINIGVDRRLNTINNE